MAHERFGIAPDMVSIAKPIAGGLPMGAILVTSEIAETIKPGDHGTTFGGGPMVAAVADYVVRRLADPELLGSVRENGEWLGEQLAAMARRSSRIRAIRGMGYMWGIDVVEPASEVVQRGWDAGLLVITAGDHTLRLLPPLVMERSDLERGLALLERILS
jgi:acetylornithine/N-succinyldiaminopimelate aminotransferase